MKTFQLHFMNPVMHVSSFKVCQVAYVITAQRHSCITSSYRHLSEKWRPTNHHHHTTTSVLRPFFRDHPGQPVPEENFWTLWCKGRLTEADIQTIRLGATPSGLSSAHLHHPPIEDWPSLLKFKYRSPAMSVCPLDINSEYEFINSSVMGPGAGTRKYATELIHPILYVD